jgi:hypothetical protein
MYKSYSCILKGLWIRKVILYCHIPLFLPLWLVANGAVLCYMNVAYVLSHAEKVMTHHLCILDLDSCLSAISSSFDIIACIFVLFQRSSLFIGIYLWFI